MLLRKKLNSGIGFARKEDYEYEGTKYEADLKSGDVIKFLDSGNVEEGNYGMQNNFKIKTRNGDKKISPNQTSINILVGEFGGETENWVGKDVNVLLKKTVINNKKCIVAYFVTEKYKLDEYGEPVLQNIDEKNTVIKNDEEPVSADSIPF